MEDRIIKAADELFMRYGLRAVTMDDLAKKLSISKKTIYQSFEDKDALVEQVALNHLEEQNDVMDKITEEALDPIDEILQVSAYIGKRLESFHPSLLYDMEKFYPKSYALFARHREGVLKECIAINMQKGIELGLYRKEININMLSILRLTQIELAFNPDLFPKEKFNMHEIQVEFITHFLYGICTLKGHKLINKYKQITEE